jgi:hypothetical protein
MDLLKAKNNTCDDWYLLCKFAAVSPKGDGGLHTVSNGM